MGIDICLEAEQFFFDCVEIDPNIEKLRAAIKDVIGETPGEVQTIITKAVYWRKANATYKWFLDNVQDGVDEGQRTYVERARLRILCDLCKEVINNPESASEKLPTQSGFLFRNAEYDDGYFDELKHIVKRLDIVLDEVKFPIMNWDFYYQTS